MTYSLYDTITVQQWTKNKNEHISINQTSEMRKDRQCIHVHNEYIRIIDKLNDQTLYKLISLVIFLHHFIQFHLHIQSS